MTQLEQKSGIKNLGFCSNSTIDSLCDLEQSFKFSVPSVAYLTESV